MAPGTTSTSRFAASASSAVEKVPDGNPASTMSVARASPAMRRLRRRKRYGLGSSSHACSETTAPPSSTMRWNSPSCSAGYSRSHPPPRNATVRPPSSSAAACAAASQPRAPPDTTTMPRRAAKAAKRLAHPRPYGVALRAPTMAMPSWSAKGSPTTYSRSGGCATLSSAEGKPSPPRASTVRSPASALTIPPRAGGSRWPRTDGCAPRGRSPPCRLSCARARACA